MAIPTLADSLSNATASGTTVEGAAPAADRAGRLLTGVVLVAIAFFAFLGIGSPLLGHGVFAGTDDLAALSPYGDVPELATVEPTNTFVDDTWDAALPNTIAFAGELREGRIAAWNPYVAGGVPLGATPNYALASPLTAPYYALPTWFAPAVSKLLEIVVAVGGMYLYLRRLGLRAAAGLLGGLAYASSAFMVVWTNWPQTRVAAFIPAVFWAVELLVRRGRVRDATVLALAVAAMLFGGFPAVTGYTLGTAALYLVARVWCVHRHEMRRAAAVLAGAFAGVAGGVLLAAVQLVPWVVLMRSAFVAGREQTPSDTLPIASLVTAVAPWALGSAAPSREPLWYLSGNLVESMSYAGAAVLVLAVTAVAMARRARAAIPRGAWTFLVAATGGWFVLIYVGGAPLAIAQRLPILFSDNFVGRGRSVLGFLLAVLAAVGLEVLLRGRPSDEPRRRVAVLWAASVWGGVALAGLAVLYSARRAAYRADAYGGGGDHMGYLTRHVAVAAVLVAAGLGCAVLMWRSRRGRPALAVALVALVAGQALSFVIPYWPRSQRATFYPVTDTHRFLSEHIGHERFASLVRSMSRSVDAAHSLRSATGHAFVDSRYGELVRTVPGAARIGGTHIGFRDTAAATSSTLDHMAVRYGVAGLDEPVLGQRRPVPGTGGTVDIAPGVRVTRPVPGTGGIRSVDVLPARSEEWGPADRIEASVRDPAGREVARTERRISRTFAGQPLSIPVAAEDVPAGTRLVATVTLRASRPLTVAAADGAVAVGAVGRADDGLRLAHVGSAAVYERLTALPRIRWAGTPVVEPDAQRRLALIAGGSLRRDQVVLERPSGAGGGTARVQVTEDGYDEIAATVTADGSGYLVVADSVWSSWTATVDGAPAALLRADHAFVAIAVPDGAHTVRLRYETPASGAGGWLSLAAAFAICATWVAGLIRDRRRRVAA